jgi:hypothetical protein
MASPRWGYTLDGRAHVFEDGVLPRGWIEVPPFDLDAMEWTKRAAMPLVLEDEDNGTDASGIGSGDNGEPRRGRGRPKRIG